MQPGENSVKQKSPQLLPVAKKKTSNNRPVKLAYITKEIKS